LYNYGYKGDKMDQQQINSYIKLLTSDLCSKELEALILKWLNYEYRKLKKLPRHRVSQILLSRFNYNYRREFKSSELVKIKVEVGDICYIDFGETYITEAGFQHFGLVLNLYNSKAFVLPMTSNNSMYLQSYSPTSYPCGKKHLFRLGSVAGLSKPSVLFLNDGKYLNTARIINVIGHLDTRSEVFKQIKLQLAENLGLDDIYS